MVVSTVIEDYPNCATYENDEDSITMMLFYLDTHLLDTHEDLNLINMTERKC